MTTPPVAPDDAPKPTGLFVSDVELAGRLGVGTDVLREAIRAFDRHRQGFPPKDAMFGGKRYFPAVKAWLDKRYGASIGRPSHSVVPDGQEHWSHHDNVDAAQTQ